MQNNSNNSRSLQKPDAFQEKLGYWHKFLFWISAHLACRIILSDSGEPYLERYHLFGLPGGGRVYLHRLVASDPDRGLHDHPWPWAVGLIVSGEYVEQRLFRSDSIARVVERRLGLGRFNVIRKKDFHRLLIAQPQQTWTLFAHGRKTSDWGFINADTLQYRHHNSMTGDVSHSRWWCTALKGEKTNRLPLQGIARTVHKTTKIAD